MNIESLILKLLNLGLVVCIAGLWAGAGLDARPKNRNEHILVGGAIWTQTLLPMGLIISAIVGEKLDNFVHGYYLFAGWVILGLPGVLLIVGEVRKLNNKPRSQSRLSFTIRPTDPPPLQQSFDKIYCGIGVLLCLASLITFVDFILTIC